MEIHYRDKNLTRGSGVGNQPESLTVPAAILNHSNLCRYSVNFAPCLSLLLINTCGCLSCN